MDGKRWGWDCEACCRGTKASQGWAEIKQITCCEEQNKAWVHLSQANQTHSEPAIQCHAPPWFHQAAEAATLAQLEEQEKRLVQGEDWHRGFQYASRVCESLSNSLLVFEQFGSVLSLPFLPMNTAISFWSFHIQSGRHSPKNISRKLAMLAGVPLALARNMPGAGFANSLILSDLTPPGGL